MQERPSISSSPRSPWLGVALGGSAALGALDLLLDAHVSPAQAVTVLVAAATQCTPGAALVTAMALLGLWLDLSRSVPPPPSWVLQGAVESAALLTVLGAATTWMRRESRRRRVAVAAAACAADLLRRNTGRFRALLDSTHDPLLLIDEAGHVQAASHSTQRVLGWPSQDLVGRSASELLPQLDLDALRALPSEPQTATGATGFRGELDATHRSGRRMPCEVVGGRVVTSREDPDPEGLFLIHVRDLTNRRTAEVERLHARKMQAIGQLATGVSHEINTPTQYVSDNLRFLERSLGALRAMMQAARDVCATQVDDTPHRQLRQAVEKMRGLEEQGIEAIREALEGVERVASIVRAMRNFSHPGSGTYSQVQLADAIADTLAVARHEWKDVAEVETHLDPDLPPIECIPGELNQVLLNLLVNAAHAIADAKRQRGQRGPSTPDRITITARRDGAVVEITVRDSGTGIPDAIRERIFEPFFTTKDVGRGTGQGLAIVHSVVHRHGGTIACTSRVGEWTQFVVRLPIEPPRREDS